jgi:hypothetical protein
VTTQDILPNLQAAGLIGSTDIRVTPLTGGVSSDIVLVESSTHRLVVKAALEKLRVKDDWFVDVSRNRVEQSFFEYVSPILPAAGPRMLGGGDGWFAMEYLGDELQNWKTALLAGHFEAETARLAGEVLGRLHAASWADPVARERFDTLPGFQALRIDPYLLTTADRVPRPHDWPPRSSPWCMGTTAPRICSSALGVSSCWMPSARGMAIPLSMPRFSSRICT